MSYYLIFLLGGCLGFALAALLAAGDIRRPGVPGRVSRDETGDLMEARYTYLNDSSTGEPRL